MSQKTIIRLRRQQIRDEAPCESCGSTLASCKAERGKDPTAPSWFGCCARGVMMDIACRHVQDPRSLAKLLDEIDSGTVLDPDQMLLESVDEFAWQRRVFARLLAGWIDEETARYGE